MKQIQTVPRVLDRNDKGLYQEVERKTAAQFGKNSLAYRTITNGININNVTGSQLFWNIYLGKYLPEDQRIISLEDAEAIDNSDETFFEDFYTDFPEVCLRTEVTSLRINNYILENLVKQVKEGGYEFSPENPLRISNLELIKDENPENVYGLLLKIGDDTKIVNDKRLAYSNDEKNIVFGERQKTVWTIRDGLSRVYLRNLNLVTGNIYLGYSEDDGRVVLVSSERGVLQN